MASMNEPPDPERLTKAFREFGAAIAQAMRRELPIATCPHCGQEHVPGLDVEIREAVERGRRRKARR